MDPKRCPARPAVPDEVAEGARDVSGRLLAIDQGTTSTRSILFDARGNAAAVAQQEFPQHYPHSGWVEHDAEDLWETALATAREAMRLGGAASGDVAAIGIGNQRETVVVWERESGQPIHRAIVWQDRRTAGMCARLRGEGLEDAVRAATGLLLDPYFSATKIAWILDHVEGAREAAREGRLACGTVDSFLLWRLTGGRVHATDATNASRTMLYDIRRGAWSDELLERFGIPEGMLPQVRDSAGDFGETEPGLLGGAVAVRGVAGDQQAATVGQACFGEGMVKATFGTGCFALLNTGRQPVPSRSRLLTTIAYQLDGEPRYALEGSVFAAGATVQWLRDGLGILDRAEQSGEMAALADPESRVYLVPAFTGLGAPWWDADCRGTIHGLTRATGREELAKAALESVCFQLGDLLDAMRDDWERTGDAVLRVDGGMVDSTWLLQRLADLLGMPVDRPRIAETTALGAACLAGIGAGVLAGPEEIAEAWRLERRFEPEMEYSERAERIAGWKDAVNRTLGRNFAGR